MSKETIIDKEELEKCKNDMYYFFKKYVLINGKEPTITDKDKWLLANLESGNIQRVWTHKYGWQWKLINQNKDKNE